MTGIRMFSLRRRVRLLSLCVVGTVAVCTSKPALGEPVITGTQSNFDVWNRSPYIANDFEVALGGILTGSITGLYNGGFNPFTPPSGQVTGGAGFSTIGWGPNEGQQVNPDGKGHFGFRITGDLTPTFVELTWTQNGEPIHYIGMSGQTWKKLTGGLRAPGIPLENTVPNNSGVPVWIQRRVNTSTTPITLDDLLVGGPLYTGATLIDPSPILLTPGASVTYVFDVAPDTWAIMIAEYFEDAGGLPGQSIGTWLDAAEVAEEEELIPTVSEWGLIIVALLLLTSAKVYFGRRRVKLAA